LTLAHITYALSDIGPALVFVSTMMTKALHEGYVGGQLVTFIQTRLAAPPHTLGFSVHCEHLVETTITPFLCLLGDWLNEGTLDKDRAREFFIWELCEGERQTTMAVEHVVACGSGERRFEMHVELCPESLREHAKDMLTCGMQVVTMREAGRESPTLPYLPAQ